MANQKNIIFFADGTWNGPDEDEDKDGVPDLTNVLKLFLILRGDDTSSTIRLKDEQEKYLSGPDGPLQVAKYLHGVGDSENPIKRLLGGVFGAGVIARIVRGYTFISRNYNPGDLISIVGFSRGAYTARALAGLISSEGLLNSKKFDLEDKDLAYSLGTSAWRSFREKAANKATNGSATKQHFFSVINKLPGFARLKLDPQDMVSAPIQCVAVWDTVGALGVPLFNQAGDQLDIFRFADADLSDNVRYGIHAISLDEQRVNFQPTLWNPRGEDVIQCLFPGAHSDVGGGYPAVKEETGLSDIALLWMIEQLAARGVLFGSVPKDVSPNPLGKLHTPWNDGIFAKLPNGRRKNWVKMANHGLIVHESIAKRVAGLPDYRPDNLPL